MAIITRSSYSKREIDLSGEQGNAYYLLGAARNLGKQLGWAESTIDLVCDDMRSHDYEHLIAVFDKHFGEIVDLIRPIPIDDDDED